MFVQYLNWTDILSTGKNNITLSILKHVTVSPFCEFSYTDTFISGTVSSSDYIVSHGRIINESNLWPPYYKIILIHTISVINSITRSSNRSTLSVYGFWSSPNPYIIHRSSLEKSRLRPERVAPRGASASSSSNCFW